MEQEVFEKINKKSKMKFFGWIKFVAITFLILAILFSSISNRLTKESIVKKYSMYISSVDELFKTNCENIPPAFIDMLLDLAYGDGDDVTRDQLINSINKENCQNMISDGGSNFRIQLKIQIKDNAVKEFYQVVDQKGWFFRVQHDVFCPITRCYKTELIQELNLK